MSQLVSEATLQTKHKFDINRYLAQEHAKDLLRFSTAGSVDDGKSTLIGRLLYDTQSVYDDQIRSIEGKGTTAPGVLDLALLTDGLRAEREQGITIDVAYRYFSTPRRKFIIADTPGHEQYTRNMATGASTSDVAIILIDARKGMLAQSRRHAYITALLGVRQVIVAINKMDLVDYCWQIFESIKDDFLVFAKQLEEQGLLIPFLHFVPLSALAGDNVVHPSTTMPWYAGEPLLALLESLPSSRTVPDAPFRFSVQRVVRPNLDFRGFAGQIASGTIRPGDAIRVLPSRKTSRIQEVVTFDGNLSAAAAPLSVTLTLEDEIDISRGDLLVSPDEPAISTSSFEASLVWMSETPLYLHRRYLLKHTSRTVQASVQRLIKVVDLSDLSKAQTGSNTSLTMNGIAEVHISTLQPLFVDHYSDNRHTGSFVLIDAHSNATVAAGMIRASEDARPDTTTSPKGTSHSISDVPPDERARRYGHIGAHLTISSPLGFARALERALFERGAVVVLHEVGSSTSEPVDLARSGILHLSWKEAADSVTVHIAGRDPSLHRSSEDNREAVEDTLSFLRDTGILRSGDLA